MTTNEIALRTDDSLAEKLEWSKAMSSGSMLPRAFQGNPANLLFALEYADALGIPRINALTSIHVIDGKPTASADLIASLVRKAGHKLRVTGDDTFAEATIIRADDPDFATTIRWDEAKARKAGKWGTKGPWTQYTGAMLRARAITEVARMAASDALYGVIYTSEEVEGGDVIDQDGNPAPAPAPRPRPATSSRSAADKFDAKAAPEEATVDVDSLLAAIESAATEDELRDLWRQTSGMHALDEQKTARDIIQARLADLATVTTAPEQPSLDAETVEVTA